MNIGCCLWNRFLGKEANEIVLLAIPWLSRAKLNNEILMTKKKYRHQQQQHVSERM